KLNRTYTIKVQYGPENVQAQTTFNLTEGTVNATTPPSEQQLQPPSRLPQWVKNDFIFYAKGSVSEDELLRALQFLIQEGIIKAR
ncbi:MAG: hypothetical protein ACREAN_05565, partial [Nitrosopumilaceae archaeon]